MGLLDVTFTLDLWAICCYSVAVSMRLSSYLQEGNVLTSQDAVVMTSCLARNVETLHRKGMAAGPIDPSRILIQQDPEVDYTYMYQNQC